MAYSTNPNLPKARAIALKLLLADGLPVEVTARKCGIHRSTLWRWKQKWTKLNKNVQLTNDNRPSRSAGNAFRTSALTWQIPTSVSRPHSSPAAIPDVVVDHVLRLREALARCAEVVWHHLRYQDGLEISLSSVRRILRRHHCFNGARKPRLRYDNPRRPVAAAPGDLVQTDTIHHVDPYSGRRLYYYTVIDLYTRMTHVTVAPRILPGLAAAAVLEAQAAWGFTFRMVQADNGPEYSRYFEQQLSAVDIQVRHSRLQRPNDNAYIERFNRTVQDECIGYHWRRSVSLQRQQQTLRTYLDYYNNDRLHLGIQKKTPRQMLQRS